MRKPLSTAAMIIVASSSYAGEIWREEFNSSTVTGVPQGLTYVTTPTGKGAKFTRTSESRVQYPYSSGMPKSGTIEVKIKIDSAYQYRNYQLSTDEQCALVFTTDVGGGDVTYPGSAWFYACKNGDISLVVATTKYGSNPAQTLSAKATAFRFGEWHTVSYSFGIGGQAIAVDGKQVASNAQNTQALGAGGTHGSPVDIPTLGESKPGFWANNQWDGGFEGVVDAFRVSNTAKDWTLAMTSITDVFPKTTIIGSPTIFTVTGTNLVAGMGFTVGDCAFSNKEIPGGTTAKRRFLCTQYGSAGDKIGLVKTKPGGTKLFTFTVKATPDNIPEVYAATDKKEIFSADEIVSILFSTTVQNKLSTSSLYDLYVKFILPDGSIAYDNGNQLVRTKTPFSSGMKFTQAQDWSSLLHYSLDANAVAGAYIAQIELWKHNATIALSKSATVFDYVSPVVASAKSALKASDPLTWLIKTDATVAATKAQVSARIGSDDPALSPEDWLKKYQTFCKQNPDSLECKEATRTVLALQLGSKYFEKLGGIEGMKGAYGIFKKGEKLAKNLSTVNGLLNYYWTYKNNSSLTSDQRLLLMAMRVANSYLKQDLMTSFVSLGDVADALEKVTEKINNRITLISNIDATAYEIYFNVVDDCVFGCGMKSFEITPVFTLSEPYAGAGLEGIPLGQYKHHYTNANNIAGLTQVKSTAEDSIGSRDYYFGKLPFGLYIAVVRYSNGEVYRQPVWVDKSQEIYPVTTGRD